ncbi:Serine phosphatase RsbU, regulator of sigma subunit [Klenkia marina]|uniref:Serine phosphatase RsbU, regulator of sigma subunit n=1 Tax=Klenkia marina TaxID=1960309 RepID=A0A1G4XQJ9_9ACTN|nr:Serine phosphatase RsbU, regulator of sigma subunit [Klenkia marina]
MLGPGSLTPVRQLFVETDWAATAIGAPDTWAPTLRAAISTAMNSRFAMLVMAGPELVMVYNDAYAPLMGGLHPALGRPLPEVWADEWPLLAPLVDAVRDDRVANRFSDFFLVTTRNGFPEEAYFTYSYSPLLDPDDQVVGVLNTVIETTEQVLATRRLHLAQRLGQVGAGRHADLGAAAAAAVDVLADHRADVPFAGVFLLADPDDPTSPLVAAAGYGLGALLGAETTPAAQQWLRRALDDRVRRTHDVDGTWGPVDDAPVGVGGGRVRTAVTLPLAPVGRSAPVGVLVLGLSPHLPGQVDDPFHDLVAHQVVVVLGATLTHLADLAASAASRSLAEALQRSLLTDPVEPDHLEIVTRYRPATTEAAIGGDWYDAFLCADGSTWLVVGDVAGHDQTAAATMAQVRNLLRGIAYGEPASPAQVLTRLDRAMTGLGVGTLTSVVAIRVEQDAEQARAGLRRLRWSNAGHPPLVLLPRGGARARVLSAPVDRILGADPTAARHDHEVDLDPGDGVLLYTDGLVERRSADLDEGVEWLLGAVSDLADRPVAHLCDRLLELVSHHAEDDVAMLALRAHPEDRPRPPEAGQEDVPALLP